MPDWLDMALNIGPLVGGALGAIAGAAVWVAKHTFVTREDLRVRFDLHEEAHKELDRRLAEGERQFTAILADLEHVPGHQDLHDLKDRIGAVEGSVKALAATVEGLKDVLERVERPLNILVDHHLKVSR